MTSAPPALFDPEPLRHVTRPTLLRPPHDRSIVVLGSTQSLDDLDVAALERDGIGLRRRRGGGGAVLLRPEDLWVELWLPRADDDAGDLRASAVRVGEWWRASLSSFGIDGAVHTGGVDERRQGALACFAATGPGEIEVGGAKLVGISQWRVRQGTLVSSVLAVHHPADLSSYLTVAAPRLSTSTCLTTIAGTVVADAVAARFVHSIVTAVPGLDARDVV